MARRIRIDTPSKVSNARLRDELALRDEVLVVDPRPTLSGGPATSAPRNAARAGDLRAGRAVVFAAVEVRDHVPEQLRRAHHVRLGADDLFMAVTAERDPARPSSIVGWVPS